MPRRSDGAAILEKLILKLKTTQRQKSQDDRPFVRLEMLYGAKMGKPREIFQTNIVIF